MEPIRVLVLVRELGIGGCERDLARAATHFDSTRVSAHVGCFHPNGIRSGDLRSQNIPIITLPLTSFLSPSFGVALRQMHKYIHDHGIDLVHSFDTPSACLLAAYGLWPWRVPIVASHLCHRDLIDNRGQQLLLRLGDRTSDAFVTNSKAVATELRERFGVSPALINTVYNGVDTMIFHPGVAPALARDPDTLTIGTVCALRPEKRIDLLMESFARLVSPEYRLRLLVVGAGPELKRLEETAERLGIAASTCFAGLQGDIPPWLTAMDVFVLPSSSESFPNSLLEAMACGLAVIGSRTGGIPEMIEDEENGLLFEPEEPESLTAALRRMIASKALRTQVGANARRTASIRYSSPGYASQLEAVYRKVLGH